MPYQHKLLISFVMFLLILFSIQAKKQKDYTDLRQRMIRKHLIPRGINDARVLDAMLKVPRHLFVPETYRHLAYADQPLPIDAQQTISQPYIVALMTQSLEIKPKDKILEIGTGSGYQAAVLSHLTCCVYTLEIIKKLADKAADTLKQCGYDQVKVKWEDGHDGWESEAPFDAIIITCASREVPPRLFQQLREGGKLILPLGNPSTYQVLTLITKENGEPKSRKILDVRFVPMTKK